MTSPLRHPPSRRPKRGALGAEARLSRLLVMLPWLMERKEVPLDEVAATFSMSRDEVVRELELASMCGLPPFVDELIDVFIDEETVFVGVPRLFTKPLRLTAPEGFALLTAGRAAMQLPGADPDSPLGRGLTKLATVLGEDPDSDPALVVDLAATDLVDEFVAATKRVERMKIRYWTASRDEVSERDVTPRRVFHERGDWYVSADDHRSGERRTFRIDRIESYERTGVFDDPLDDAEIDDAVATSSVSWSVDGSLPRVTLRLQPAARWVIEQYPFDSVVEQPRGVVDATFAVTSERWLERLLLRAGTDAEVVTPAEYALTRRGRGDAGACPLHLNRVGVDRRSRPGKVELVELRRLGDGQIAEQQRQHRGGRRRIRQCVVVVGQRHVVSGADVGETVRECPVGVEPTRQVERAQAPIDAQRHACPCRGSGDELGVELRVVGGEHCAIDTVAELAQRGRGMHRVA